jgi:hypothetical protein
MRIRFMGLICHVDDEDVAVLMTADDHIPLLRVPNRFRTGFDDNATGTICDLLSDRTISFSLSSGTVSRTGLTGVPKLSDLGATSVTLHANVALKDATDHSDSLEAFVVLPAGSYGVEDWYALKGTIAISGSPVCVARTVIFDATASSSITVSGLASSLSLKPNAIITVTNLEAVPNSTSHFSTYGDLFDPPASITSPSLSLTVCPEGSDEYAIPTCTDDGGYLNIGVECSNSTYP